MVDEYWCILGYYLLLRKIEFINCQFSPFQHKNNHFSKEKRIPETINMGT
jgi:hypothetical protein